MGIEAHSEQFTIQGPVHNLPYEPDKFAVKPILLVPFAVIASGIIAFIITTLIFDNIFDPNEQAFKEPSTFAEAAERGRAPLNDRLARMSSTDPNAEVNAPRLEGMRRTEVILGKDDKPAVTAEWTTTLPLPASKGNSPEYHPEDLRADRQPGLTKYAKNGTQVTIPVDKAMDLITGGLVGVQPNAKPLPINADWDRPKESNGGQPTTTQEPKKASEHKEEHKKEEHKEEKK